MKNRIHCNSISAVLKYNNLKTHRNKVYIYTTKTHLMTAHVPGSVHKLLKKYDGTILASYAQAFCRSAIMWGCNCTPHIFKMLTLTNYCVKA